MRHPIGTALPSFARGCGRQGSRIAKDAMRRLLIVVLVVVVTTSCSSRAGAPGATTSAALVANATVVYVSDGDTIGVRIGDQEESVRLVGIDTPEVKDPRKPVQCFGREASEFTKRALPKGTPVRLERDVEPRDQYGRLLAYVYRAADGSFVNLELARQGYADVLTYPPNVAHAEEFRAAVAAARRDGLGLWRACDGFGVPAG